jgi:hypothetical protein
MPAACAVGCASPWRLAFGGRDESRRVENREAFSTTGGIQVCANAALCTRELQVCNEESAPCIRPCARGVRSLPRRAGARFTEPSVALFKRGCLSRLRNHSAHPPEGNQVLPARPCSKAKGKSKPSKARISSRRLRPESPSEGRTQALHRGTRGMDAERGTKGQGRPFVTCPRSDAGVRGVWSHSGQTRMQGWPSFWLLFLGQTRKSDAPREAQPVLPAEESVTPGAQIHATPVENAARFSTLRFSPS